MGDIMPADEARRRMGWDLADAVGRLAKAEARADAAEAERDALRAQLVALANEARPLVEATEGHTPGPWHVDDDIGGTMAVEHQTDPDGGVIVLECVEGMEPEPVDLAAILAVPQFRDIAARLVALAGGGEDG